MCRHDWQGLKAHADAHAHIHTLCLAADDPSSPSLRIAPAVEMYGHLVLMVGSLTDGPLAATHFTECLNKLPRRQSCVLGAARAAALSGNATAASSGYAAFWAQCAGAAAPPDFMYPGLMEAFFAIVPDNVTAVDLQDSINSTSLAQSRLLASNSTPGMDAGSSNTQPPQPSQPPPRAAPTTYHHSPFYYYGLHFTYTPTGSSSPGYYGAYTAYQRYPAPYAYPLDFDPVNRDQLSSMGYSYGSGAFCNAVDLTAKLLALA